MGELDISLQLNVEVA